MPLLTRKQAILIEIESSYADSTVPTGADALLVSNLSITPLASDVVTRDYVRPYLGAAEQLLANTRVEITFSVELVASGTKGTAPGYNKALLACGLSETVSSGTSVTYAPVSGSFSSAVIHYFIDGVRHKCKGARGSFALSAEVGAIPTLDFTFTGLYESPDDSALPTPTFNDQPTPLIFKSSNTTGFNILGHQAGLNSFSVDVANTITYREVIGGATPKEVLLTERASNGSVTIDAVLMATKNFFDLANTDASLGALSVTHGTQDGQKVQFISSKCDISDPSYGDADGITTLEIPFTLVPSASGNDEFSLVYS